jgi:hypothetical protein
MSVALMKSAGEDELQAYRDFVAATAATSKVIINRDEIHAAVLMAQIFRSSRERVDLITRSLEHEAFQQPELIQAAVDFLRSSYLHLPSLRVLFAQGDARSTAIWRQLMANGLEGAVELVKIPQMLWDRYPCEIMIGDRAHFRFQPGPTSEAFIRFGDPHLGQQVQSRFDEILKHVQILERAPSAV